MTRRNDWLELRAWSALATARPTGRMRPKVTNVRSESTCACS